MKTLPEICESCHREVRDLERVIMLLTREEKRGPGDVPKERRGRAVPRLHAEGRVAPGNTGR